jgi:hypothetical protein
VLLTVHCAAYGGVNSLWSRLVQAENDNGKLLPEDDPAGSKHVGVCYNLREKKLFVHLLVINVFCSLPRSR